MTEASRVALSAVLARPRRVVVGGVGRRNRNLLSLSLTAGRAVCCEQGLIYEKEASFADAAQVRAPAALLNPTPYTLHPTPYTLHPTPYTLHPAPFTIHYTLHTLRLGNLRPPPRLTFRRHTHLASRSLLPAPASLSHLARCCTRHTHVAFAAHAFRISLACTRISRPRISLAFRWRPHLASHSLHSPAPASRSLFSPAPASRSLLHTHASFSGSTRISNLARCTRRHPHLARCCTHTHTSLSAAHASRFRRSRISHLARRHLHLAHTHLARFSPAPASRNSLAAAEWHTHLESRALLHPPPLLAAVVSP